VHLAWPSSARALLLPALAGALGCAEVPVAKMTFREAGLEAGPPRRAAEAEPTGPVAAVAEPDGALPPPVAVAAPEAVPSEQPEGPPIDPVLIRFAGEARGRRLRTRPGQGFPADASQAWRALLDELDLYLTRPLPQTPLLELVRSQVTLEAEWDYDQRRYGSPPAAMSGEVAARARRLGVRIHAARALGQTMFVKRPPGKLRWPIDDAGLSSGFGQRLHPMTGELQWHAGIDLATERGRVVGSADKGYVIRAGWAGGYGLLVEVRHPGELTTRYAHLAALLCAPGDSLDAGQAVGLVGQTGLATGPHLHFEVWRGGAPSDPLGWLGGGSQLAGAPQGGVGGGARRGGPGGSSSRGAGGGPSRGGAGDAAGP
jgi:murein DD-endopeptidase MepM/ murein hydrolase activator NlpD